MGIRRGSISTPIIADGLIFNMDAANRACYINGSTKSLNTINLSQSGSINAVQFDSSNLGTWDFDGTEDYIEIQQSNNLKFGTGGFSLGLWAYVRSWSTGGGLWDRIFFLGNTLFSDSLSWNLDGSTGKSVFRVNDTIRSTSAGAFTLNSWKYYVFTRDGSTLKHYFNGSISTTTTYDIGNVDNMGNYRGFIGRGDQSQYTNSEINAIYGPIHIYNRALSANEVLHNYNALKGRFGL